MLAWKHSGIKPESLKDFECPESLIYLWHWFNDLANACGSNKLDYIQVKSWADLMNIDITPFECETLFRLDRMYWKQINNG